MGARRIGVFGVPPIGCLPSQRTLTGGVQRNCVENYNQVAQMFNAKLKSEMNSLNILPLARMVYIDVYNLPLDLIFNPKKYGKSWIFMTSRHCDISFLILFSRFLFSFTEMI